MTRTSLAHCQHPGGEAAMPAATVLYACAEVGICLGCLAPPRKARGQARGRRRDDDETTDISPSLHSDPHARGYGCARETLCAARRDEVARARETLCACRGRRSRTAGGFHVPWSILVVCSTCDRTVLSEGLGRQGMRYQRRRSLSGSKRRQSSLCKSDSSALISTRYTVSSMSISNCRVCV